MITVRARLGTIPDEAETKLWAAPEGTVPAEPETREVTATAETYEQARDELIAGVPAGWRVLHLIVER